MTTQSTGLPELARLVLEEWNTSAPGPRRNERYVEIAPASPGLHATTGRGWIVEARRQIVRYGLSPRVARASKAPARVLDADSWQGQLRSRTNEYPLVAAEQDVVAVGPVALHPCKDCRDGRRACPSHVPCPKIITETYSEITPCSSCNGRGEAGRRVCLDCNGAGFKTIQCTNCHGSGCTQCKGGRRRVYCTGCEGRRDVPISCTRCIGSGRLTTAAQRQVQCAECGGSGQKTCDRCGGSGSIICSTCGGDGSFATWRTGSRVFAVEALGSQLFLQPDCGSAVGLEVMPSRAKVAPTRRLSASSPSLLVGTVSKLGEDAVGLAEASSRALGAQPFGSDTTAVIVDILDLETVQIEGTLADRSALHLGGWRYAGREVAGYQCGFGIPPVDPARAESQSRRDRVAFLVGSIAGLALVLGLAVGWHVGLGAAPFIGAATALIVAFFAIGGIATGSLPHDALESWGQGALRASQRSFGPRGVQEPGGVPLEEGEP